MKFNYEWLKEYVNLNIEPEQLAKILTNAGIKVESITKVGDDCVFDLEITSNRGDLLGIIGIAKELSALTGCELRLPPIYTEGEGREYSEYSNVSILDKDLCPRYTATFILGVKIAPSPKFIANRLTKIGLRTVNNVVDVTNYVMYEIGQPLHAFDMDKIEGGRVIIRRARNNESIVAIDGREYKLDDSILAICDEKKPIAIAGVMGGIESEVSEKTRNILLESAKFNSSNIRKTSRKLGLSSDSSYRFERVNDITIVEWAARRVSKLLIEIAGAQVIPNFIDINYTQFIENIIQLRYDRIKKILGRKIENGAVKKILMHLGFIISDEQENLLLIKTPPHRPDIEREIDLIEEIARIYGYDSIPVQPAMKISMPEKNLKNELQQIIRRSLKEFGFSEIISTSFIEMNSVSLNDFGFWSKSLVGVLNKKLQVDKYLRNSLIPTILEVKRNNEYYKENFEKGYEIGQVFYQIGNENFEFTSIGMFLSSEVLNLNSIIRQLFRNLKIKDFDIKPEKIQNLPLKRTSILLIGEKKIGYTGQLTPKIFDKFDLKIDKELSVCEINFDEVLENWNPDYHYEDFSRLPSVERDLSVVVDKKTKWSDILNTLKLVKCPFLQDTKCFDVYDLGTQKSIAFRIIFRSMDKTLTNEEVNQYMEKIIHTLETKLNAKLREAEK